MRFNAWRGSGQSGYAAIDDVKFLEDDNNQDGCVVKPPEANPSPATTTTTTTKPTTTSPSSAPGLSVAVYVSALLPVLFKKLL